MPRLNEMTDEELLAEARRRRLSEMSTEELQGMLRGRNLPELREQPSGLVEAMQPGGLISPENVGTFAGGMMGAMYGAGLGPVGMAGGGLIGAGLGALSGRLGEVATRRIWGPTGAGPVAGTTPLSQQQPPLGQDVGDLGAAATRGMIAEGLGQVGGIALTKAARTLAAPFAARVNPAMAKPGTLAAVQERARLNAQAEQLGIPLSAAQQTQAKSLGLLERMTEDVPIGTAQAQEFIATQRAAVENATDDLLGTIAPRSMRDALNAGTLAQGTKLARQEAAEREASRLYNLVGDAAGPAKFPAVHLRREAERLAKVQRELAGLGTPAEGRAAALAPALRQKPPEPVKPQTLRETIAQIGPEAQQMLATPPGGQRVYQAGKSPAVLDDFARWTEEGLAADGQTRARLAEVLGGGRFRDLEQAAEVAMQTGDEALLRAVNEAGERLDLSPIPLQRGQLGVSPADLAVDPARGPVAFLEQYAANTNRPFSFAALREMQSRLGELGEAAKKAGNRRIAGQYKLLFRAVSRDIDAVGEQLPEVRPLLETASTYYKTKLLRPHLQPFFTRGPRAFDNIDPQDAADVVFRPGVTVGRLKQVREAVGPRGYNGILAAKLQDTVARSYSPQTGDFEIGRFLTQWGPRQYEEASLKEMFGAQRYPAFRRLIETMQDIQRSNLAAANPSGTGQRLLSAGQWTGIVSFSLNNPGAAIGGLVGGALGKKAGGDAGMLAGGIAGGIAGNYLGGELDFLPGGEAAGGIATASGIVALSPIGLSRVLFSPEGLQWLTKGLTVTPGTQEALRIAARLLAVANKEQATDDAEALKREVELVTGSPVRTRREAGQREPRTLRETLRRGLEVQP